MADAGQVPEGVRRQNGRARARGREPRQRTQRPTRPFPIKGARARYRRALRAAVRELPPIVRDTIIIEMRRIEQTQDVTGALPVGWIAAVNGAALTAYRRWLGTTGQATNAAAARSFREVNAINMRSVSAQIRSLTGLDVFLPDTGLDDIRQAYLMQNPRLLNVATEEEIGKMRDIVIRGYASGQRASEMAPLIARRLQVTDSRAVLIAEDQVGKLNGNLTRMRHLDLGITRYTWRSSEDEAVRRTHRIFDGNEYSYEQGGSPEGNPGEPVRCRCHADPIIPGMAT